MRRSPSESIEQTLAGAKIDSIAMRVDWADLSSFGKRLI